MDSTSAVKKIALALPCYNPREGQWANLEKFISVDLKPIAKDLRILVIDDGSERWIDPPESLLRKVDLVRMPKNQGKGGVLRKAAVMASSDTEAFAFLDFDLPYTAKDLIGMICSVLQGEDACIGDRSLNAGSHRLSRAISHTFFRLFMRMLITGGVPDTQCGVKVYDAKALKHIAKISVLNGFLFDVEWIYIALKHRMAIRYWPVHIEDTHESTPLRSFGLKKLLSQLASLIKNILKKSYESQDLLNYLEEKRNQQTKKCLEHL